MLKITCFGGVGEIGGNKILLEDSGSALMLDFGKSFSAAGNYFDEFLQPRTNSCLRDLLTLNILPRIPGIYRQDMLKHAGVWDVLSDDIPDSARRLYECDLEGYDEYTAKYGKKLDGILISHSHTDHYQYLSFVDPKIPVYCTETSWAILKAAEDIGRGNYESDIIESPSRSHTTTKSGAFPGALKIEKDKTACSRNIIVVENGRPFNVGGFQVEAVPVDHSVPGACSFIITAPSGKTIFYTGDIRFHGRFSLPPYNLTENLRARTKGFKPDVVLTEGTRIASHSGDNELGVEKGIREVIEGCSGLAIVDFGWKDTTRFETILNVAKASNRVLAVSPKLAYLWAILRDKDPENYADLIKMKT